MKNNLLVFLALLLLAAVSPACAARNKDLKVSNLRTALDKDGKDVTSTFSPSDIIYVVADLANAPRGTKLDLRWIAVNAAGAQPGYKFDSQTLEITDEIFTGTTYFQLSNAVPWPVGKYRVDLYVNDKLADSLEFEVQ